MGFPLSVYDVGVSLSTLGGWVVIFGCSGVYLFREYERRCTSRRKLVRSNAPSPSPSPSPNPSEPQAPPDPTPFVRSANLTHLAPAGAGLEFTVYRARSPQHTGPVALRIPHSRILSNANDAHLDARALLAQELAIYTHLAGTAIPTPQPYGLVEPPDGGAAMLASFVETDASAPTPRAVGRLLGTLHSLPPLPAPFLPAVQEGDDALTTIAARLPRHFAALAALRPDIPTLNLSPADVLAILAPLSRFPSRLLHMDFRGPNLLARGARIVAVVDWANALVGPAAVELCRLRQIAHPGAGFDEGYAETAPLVPQLGACEEAVLRLDAAVMLALVFLSEAPDPVRADECVEAVTVLLGQLKKGT